MISLWNYRHPPTPLYINDFKEIRYVSSEIPNNYKKTGGLMNYIQKNKKPQVV